MSEKQKRGFALMDPEYRKKIATKGGLASHAKGTAHKWTAEEAQAVGRKGGLARTENLRAREKEALKALGEPKESGE